jgi:hypothetical protein
LLVCPNNSKKSADEEEQPKPRKKPRGKKGATPAIEAAPAAAAVKCDYSRSIPTPEWMTQGRSGDSQQEAV